jgi:hypothetical protein
MKKIRRIADIKAEKMKLRIKELELEKEIRQNWKELKVQLKPETFLKNKLNQYTEQDEKEENFVTSAISFGVGYLTKKLTEKLVDKIASKAR